MPESFFGMQNKNNLRTLLLQVFMFGKILREELRQAENGGVRHMSDIAALISLAS